MAKLALTLAWSTASNMFLLSTASVCAAANNCFLHSSFREVMAFCCVRRILLISSAMSLFSSFWVPSICGLQKTISLEPIESSCKVIRSNLIWKNLNPLVVRRVWNKVEGEQQYIR